MKITINVCALVVSVAIGLGGCAAKSEEQKNADVLKGAVQAEADRDGSPQAQAQAAAMKAEIQREADHADTPEGKAEAAAALAAHNKFWGIAPPFVADPKANNVLTLVFSDADLHSTRGGKLIIRLESNAASDPVDIKLVPKSDTKATTVVADNFAPAAPGACEFTKAIAFGKGNTYVCRVPVAVEAAEYTVTVSRAAALGPTLAGGIPIYATSSQDFRPKEEK